MTKRIYVASSWRNIYQPWLVRRLDLEWQVYDFRNPEPGNEGFHWSEIDPEWKTWTTMEMWDAHKHVLAEAGFKKDKDALDWCDACVLLMPSGRSAALEAGYCIGQGKPTGVLCAEDQEPELMLKLADFLTDDIEKLCDWLRTQA